MKFNALSGLALMGVILSGCSGPQATKIASGTSSADRRIAYTISQYEEPYLTENITATYVLETKAALLEVDSKVPANYWGMSDAAWQDLYDTVDQVCRQSGGRLNKAVDKLNLNTKRIKLYFNCT